MSRQRRRRKPPAKKTHTRTLRAATSRLGGGLARLWRATRRGMSRLGGGLARLWRATRRGMSRLGQGLVRLWRAARPVLLYLLLVCVLTGVLALTVSGSMVKVTADRILTDEEAGARAADRPFDCILILGAGLRDDGSPSSMLEDRVLTGCWVFLSDPAGFGVILMSGDHTGDYNEVAAMKTLAEAEGVDSDRIWLDPKGYSTYESVYRVREEFGARRVLIVTQEYHLYRALYIAQSLGMDAYGLSADRRPYRGELWRQCREVLARYKDYFTAGRGEPVSTDTGAVLP